MTIEPPAPGEPRRPTGPRDPGDAWVIADDGTRYWGRFGAAGLLAWDPARGVDGSVLLQHRVAWSHHGGTWGIPGGARHEGEDAATGAVREAQEEAGVPDGAVRPLLSSLLDLEIWTYTTLVGEVVEPFEPVIADPESVALEWVPVADVDRRPLHPGFAASWPHLRAMLAMRAAPVLVVDAANVVGSVPDGWWKDRAGAAGRLRDRLDALAAAGLPGDVLELSGVAGVVGGGVVWYPDIVLVVEGAARAIPAADSRIRVVTAPGEGDDAIVAEVRRHRADGRAVITVTSDRGLVARVQDAGATTRGVRWLRDLLDAPAA